MASPILHPLPLLISLVLLLSYPCLSKFRLECHEDDRKAVLAIKSFWGNPVSLETWGTADYDCCIWSGVYCHNTGRVTILSISGDTSITGTIPPSIGDLPFLKYLYLRELPNLIGPIIPAISRLTELITLIMNNNGLSGPIPLFLATMPNLQYIDLSSNKLIGNIPLQLMYKVGTLNLGDNELTGSIPDSFGRFPSPIYDLILSGNNLTGTVPRFLVNTGILALDLSRNKLSGNPSFLFGVTTLCHIRLSRNMFEFDLSGVTFQEHMSVLDISHNKIYGRIPPQLAKLHYLIHLNVSYNRLCGRIPTGADLDEFDQWSYVHNECLCGTPLPPCK